MWTISQTNNSSEFSFNSGVKLIKLTKSIKHQSKLWLRLNLGPIILKQLWNSAIVGVSERDQQKYEVANLGFS